MQVEPIITEIEAAVSTQLALVGSDPAVEQAASMLMAALEPALRRAGMALAEQAADEISAQLPDRNVQVLMVEGEPTLRVVDANGAEAPPLEEEFDARITLRLPPSLKDLVESAASETGDSINAWVVKTLSSRARTSAARPGKRFSGSFEL